MKKVAIGIIIAICSCLTFTVKAQNKTAKTGYQADSLQCVIIGFHFAPWLLNGALGEMFSSPVLDFGASAMYKLKSNWLFGIEGNFFFGNDNLKNRKERLDFLYSSEGTIIGTGGGDAGVDAFNRGFTVLGQVGKIFPVNKKNPNSGVFIMLGAGLAQNQIVYQVSIEEAPQISGDYTRLYDHQQRGPVLSERIGYWFMSNRSNYLNFHVSLEFTQMWLRSTRDYVIDNYMGIKGKDNKTYFSPVFGIKIGWMFPLEGKSTQDYYYY